MRITFEKNQNDWRSDRGHVDSIEIIVINDATARTAALSSGQALALPMGEDEAAGALRLTGNLRANDLDSLRASGKEVLLYEDLLADFGLLESAALRPQQTVAGHDAYPTLEEKAAALMHSLIRNHPFVDGNGRTSRTRPTRRWSTRPHRVMRREAGCSRCWAQLRSYC